MQRLSALLKVVFGLALLFLFFPTVIPSTRDVVPEWLTVTVTVLLVVVGFSGLNVPVRMNARTALLRGFFFAGLFVLCLFVCAPRIGSQISGAVLLVAGTSIMTTILLGSSKGTRC